MSMPNFNTMRNFPLYVRDFVSEVDYYPACNTYGEDGVCPICGATTERKAYLDEVAAFEFVEEMETRLNDANAKLEFHSISTMGGKYYGVQFYVEEKHDPNEYDNDDCHYYFDVCRSVAIRRYNSEINKINRILKMLAKEYGFDEVYCSAVFGNGEAVYTKVENTQRARIVRAIKEIA